MQFTEILSFDSFPSPYFSTGCAQLLIFQEPVAWSSYKRSKITKKQDNIVSMKSTNYCFFSKIEI